MLTMVRVEQQKREQGIALAKNMRERLYGTGAYKELHETRQWVNWRLERIHGTWKKVPYNPRNGWRASSINPQTWGYLPQALARLQLGDMNGIGLMVGPNDPYCIVDIDERQERETRKISGPLGKRIFALLDTITEYSPNFGLHFLVKLEKPLPEAVKDEVELYFAGRYMTVTADLVPHSPVVIATRQAEIEALFMQYKGYSFDQARTASSPLQKVTRGRVGRGASPTPDAVDWRTLSENHFDDEHETPARPTELVLQMMMRAVNRENILELWENRWQENTRYQDRGGRPDESRADMALVKYLLYWTGGHKAQTNELFERSLLMRPKWRDRVNSGGSGHSYGEITIVNAVNWLREQEARNARCDSPRTRR